ncbi:hypothetical protein GOODEAATRI_021430, partial [Goodea atripinnis]
TAASAAPQAISTSTRSSSARQAAEALSVTEQPSARCLEEANTLTQEHLDGMQGLLVSHQLRDDGQLAALAVLESSLAYRLRSKTRRLAVEGQQ